MSHYLSTHHIVRDKQVAFKFQKHNLQLEQIYQNCKNAHGREHVKTTVHHPPSFAVCANVSNKTKVLTTEQLFSAVHSRRYFLWIFLLKKLVFGNKILNKMFIWHSNSPTNQHAESETPSSQCFSNHMRSYLFLKFSQSQ